MFEVTAGAGAHCRPRPLPSIVRAIQREDGRVIVVGPTQPVALRGQEVPARESPVTALDACIGGFFPFPKPGFLVMRIDAACGQEAFGNGRTRFLSCPSS